jgi:hypothetical protein
MAAHGVHGFDGRTAGYKRAMDGLNIFEAHGRLEREFNESGAATGEQEKYQGAFIASAQKAKDRFGGSQTVAIGEGMTRKEIIEARDGRGRFCGSGNDALQGDTQREERGEAGHHGMYGFSNAENEDAGNAREIDGSVRKNEASPFERELTPHHGGDINGRKRLAKDFAGDQFCG